eukprot:364558-Chlamydomonas_euryale.AAC.1
MAVCHAVTWLIQQRDSLWRTPHTRTRADSDAADGTFPGVPPVREEELVVATRNFAKGSLIGTGGFGKVSLEKEIPWLSNTKTMCGFVAAVLRNTKTLNVTCTGQRASSTMVVSMCDLVAAGCMERQAPAVHDVACDHPPLWPATPSERHLLAPVLQLTHPGGMHGLAGLPETYATHPTTLRCTVASCPRLAQRLSKLPTTLAT